MGVVALALESVPLSILYLRCCVDAACRVETCLETSSPGACLLPAAVEGRTDAVRRHGLLCSAR